MASMPVGAYTLGMEMYGLLMQEYYRVEEGLLREAEASLSAASTAEEGRKVLDDAVGRLRAFVVEALQRQNRRIGELDDTLRVTGDALADAQRRMEAMERENEQAAAVLLRMRVLGEAQAPASKQLEARVAEQEVLLQRREAELAALRKQCQEAQFQMQSLLTRLEEEERRRSAGEPGALAQEAPSEEAQDFRRRLEDAEALLKQRDAEHEQLRDRLREAETAKDLLARRIQDYQEARAWAEREKRSVPEAPPEVAAEIARLEGLLRESQTLARQRESEDAALKQRLAQVEPEAATLRQRLAELEAERVRAQIEASARPADEAPVLQARLVELERRLKEREPAVEALRRQLKDEEAFRVGFMQRIQALEAQRDRAQEQAKAEAENARAVRADGPVPWAQERQELEERLRIMDRDLTTLRRTHENSQRDWVETMARQDSLRLQEIAELKRELEKLRAALRSPN